MDLNQFIAWKLNTWQHDSTYLETRVREMEDEVERGIFDHVRLLERHRASLKWFKASLSIVRQVSARRHAPHTMTPEMAAWWRWIQAIAPTYDNHPRLNEAANDAARKAATDDRDRELMRLKESAA